jgi:hypothetical protein
VLQQHQLDLARVDVLAASDDHLCESALDPAVAPVVHAAEVAGVQPALRVDGPRGGFRVVEVSGRDVVSAGADLAGLAQRRGLPGQRIHDLDFGAGERPPDRLGLIGGPVAGPGTGNDG